MAVLSYKRWQRLFNGDPNAIGKTLKLNDEDYTIVGVMPPRFGWWTDTGLLGSPRSQYAASRPPDGFPDRPTRERCNSHRGGAAATSTTSGIRQGSGGEIPLR